MSETKIPMDITDLGNNVMCGEIFIEWAHILDYWTNYVVDEENGGFYGTVKFDNTPDKTADKGIILNTRILWTFSAAYKYLGGKDHKKLADKAYRYLIEYFVDKEYGGVYWAVDFEGNVKSNRKQIYAQAFAIYALAEYYSASNDNKALKMAIDIFQLLEKYSYDPKNKGYIEAFNRQWGMLEDVRLSPKDMNALKTMNTHLHVLEAYTSLYNVWKDNLLKKQLAGLIRTFSDHIVNPATCHLNLFFDKQWNLISSITSYGHDIEASWLLYEAAEILGDEKRLNETGALALKIAEAAIEGIDKDGGLMNEFNYKTRHLDDDKHWWPQAEAMVGFFNAYQLTGEAKYLDLFRSSWLFISNFIIDHDNGEWYWKVSRAGEHAEEEKAGFWKCPYHNSRACMEILKRMKQLH